MSLLKKNYRTSLKLLTSLNILLLNSNKLLNSTGRFNRKLLKCMNNDGISTAFLFRAGDRPVSVLSLGVLNLGPKSHEISLKNLTQIFSKSSYDPRRRYEAHRRRDIKKISLRVPFKIFRRSSNKSFLRSSWDLKKNFWRFIRRLTDDFIRRSSVHFWPFDKNF